MCSDSLTPPTNHRSDRRSNRTRRLLREALFTLILEKGYEAVTIEDITNRADLGRTTFYLHYRDKEDLMLESIDSIAAELHAKILPEFQPGTPIVKESMRTPLEAICMFFENAAQNTTLYQCILRGEGTPRAPARIRELISGYMSENLRYRISLRGQMPDDAVPIEVTSSFFAGSLMAVLTWWLENDMPVSPMEISKMYITLTSGGIRKVYGLGAVK